MDILLKYGINPISSENCICEIKFIRDPDIDNYLCVGVLVNMKNVYLLNVNTSKIDDEKVKNILTTFNSHNSLLKFNSIIKITESSVIFCYDFTNMPLVNYLLIMNQNNSLQMRLNIFRQMTELVYYFYQKNIELDVYNPKLFFIINENGPRLKVLYHSKFFLHSLFNIFKNV